MELEVLVSTMNLEEPEKLIKNMNIQTKYTIINQVKEKIDLPQINNVYNYSEIGLSKSRNRALEHAGADICLIADDDVKYVDNYEEIIKNSYKKYKSADIIIFHLESQNLKRPIKKIKSKKINQINVMRVISSQISLKKSSLQKNNIKFDEKFGAGSLYDRGEETIMLTDALRKKLKIINVNETIGYVRQEESTWFKGFNENFFLKQGACFYRINKKTYIFLILQYAIRKYKLYRKNLKLKVAIKNMLKGANQYKKYKGK